ncbi:DUF2470 domain-containing protein [Rhodococcus sp. WMMA185]|uniref:DUF2470 domain-containing protein n=1 Tax=Rhodococcus sp. WMMA185 TaxID=679318 RepID=UPI00087849E0|nr:DUF2470 domain-containing protein [Rhodococcus sp. WMMA185]AOW93808.1 DUF2470 domain-containing protein [Rhodococcus sp. WMMA185]
MPAARTGPSAAERLRSSCARIENAVLAVEGSAPTSTTVAHMRSEGDIVVAVPNDSVAATLSRLTGAIPALLEYTDNSPLALREPVRSLVWLRGNLHALCEPHARSLADEVASEFPHPGLLDVGHDATLLQLHLETAVIADSSGAESVDIEDLLAARPDPFRETESAWLLHLDEDHRELLDVLSRKLPRDIRRERIRPLGIDRYGLRLRVECALGDRDIRLPFAAPVDDVTALSRALRVLAGCPFLNGLRARS